MLKKNRTVSNTNNFTIIQTILLSLILLLPLPSYSLWVQTNSPGGNDVLSFTLNGTSVIAGFANNYVFTSSDNGSTWSQSRNGLPYNVSVRALLSYGTRVFAGTDEFGLYISEDGLNWTDSTITGLHNLTITALLAVNSRLYAGTQGNGIFTSTNYGNTWTASNTGLPQNSIVNQIISDGSGILIATSTGIYRSEDNGNNWISIYDQYIKTIASNNSGLYAGTNDNGIIHSTDYGSSWSTFNSGLSPTESVYSIIVNGSNIFATTASGVYCNTGSEWSVVNSGLPQLTNYTPVIISGTDILIGTRTGIWKSPVPPQFPPSSLIPSNNASNLQDSVTFYWNAISIASSYSFQLSTDSLFTSSILNYSTGLSTNSITIKNLTKNTKYYWRVNASNAAGTSTWSTTSKFTTTLWSPTLLTPIDKSINQPLSVSLFWNPVSASLYYSLQLGTDSSFNGSIIHNINNIQSTNETISGLMNNTTYYWRVKAANSGGTSSWSAVNKFTTITGIPGKPILNLPANNVSGLSLSLLLSWNAVPTATSYSLQVSTDSTFSKDIIYSQSTINNTSQTISGLLNNTTYYWRVCSTNMAGSGDWSLVNHFTTILSVPTLLSPPTASTGIPTTVTLSWNPVSSASTYSLQVAKDNNFTNLIFNQSGLTSTDQSLSGLLDNQTYYWRVNATNTGATSAWSTTNTFSTILLAPQKPQLVSPLNNAVNQGISLTLSWTPISPVSSYSLQVSTDSTFSSTIYNLSNISTAAQTLSGFSYAARYFWRVNAVNTAGTGQWSSINSFSTIIATPAILSPVNGSGNQPSDITISWNSINSATSYTVQIATDLNFVNLVFNQTDITETSQEISGLSNSTIYYCRVNAANESGTGAWSTKTQFTTAAATPGTPVLSIPVNNAVNQATVIAMQWVPVSGAVSYTLQVSTDSTFTQPSVYFKSGITTAQTQVNGLFNNTTYFWRVQASNTGGTGNWSIVNNFTTIRLPPSTPSMVTPLNGSTNQSTNLVLSWSPVQDAVSYTLQVSSDPTFATTNLNQSSITTTSYTVTGLANNTTYYWRVNAVNNAGASTWPTRFLFQTVPLVAGIPALISPANNANGQPVSVQVQWATVTGATSYTLQVSEDSTFTSNLTANQTGLLSTSFLLSGLSNNTTYFWRVNATNTAGTGSWSNVNYFSTVLPPPTPRSPANNATGQFTPITFRWDADETAETFGLKISTDSLFKAIIVNQNGLTAPQYTVPNCTNNMTYYWVVNATNRNGTSLWSVRYRFSTALATPVLTSPVNNALNQPATIKLAWNPVTTAKSYSLQISTDSLFTNTHIYSQNELTTPVHTITGLSNNTLYYWRVSANNSSGSSGWSSVYQFTTTTGAPVLTTPENNTLNQPLNLALIWNTAAFANTYFLQVSTDSNFTVASSFVFNQSGLRDTSQALTNLTYNKKYYWRVCATTESGGISAWSPKSNFTTIISPPLPVSPVKGATNQPVACKLSWNTFPSIISYTVQVSTDSTFSSSVFYNQSGITTTSQVVSGLSYGAIYYWRICGASNNGGLSAWSAVSSFSTTPSAPTPITPVSGTLQTVTFAWDSVPGSTSYSLQISKDSNFINSIIYNQSNIVTTSQTVSNLSSGTVYFWRVNATSMTNGTGVWSIVSRMVTISATPAPVSPVNNGTNIPVTTVLTWNSVSEAVSYSVQISPDSLFTDVQMYTIAKNSVNVSGLDNNIVYYWRVNVTNAGGTSPWSHYSSFKTIIAPPETPNPNGTASSPAQNTLAIVVIWEPVASASSYTLQVAKDSLFTHLVYNQSGIVKTSQTITGLASNLMYYWRVNAVNAGGTSSWSSLKYFEAKTSVRIKTLPSANLPKKFELQNALYSPIGSQVSVTFAVPLTREVPLVMITIYDLRGREVTTVMKTWISAGYHRVYLNVNKSSISMRNGKYICLMKAPDFTQAGTLSIIK